MCIRDRNIFYAIDISIIDERMFAGTLKSLKRFKVNFSFISVSYTHLDVYKRQVFVWWCKVESMTAWVIWTASGLPMILNTLMIFLPVVSAHDEKIVG